MFNFLEMSEMQKKIKLSRFYGGLMYGECVVKVWKVGLLFVFATY